MYFTTADTSKALQYYFEAYELAEQNNLPKSRNEVCKGIANTYLFMGENARALAYAQKAATMADSVTSFSLQYTLAECYKACDSLKKAKKIYELISHDSNQMNSYFVYRNLSEITFQAQDPLLAYAYMDSAFECLENRYLKTEHVKDEYYQEILAKELEKERLLHQAKLNKWVAAFIISVLALIALIIYNVLRKRIAAERQRRLGHLLSQRNEHLQHLLAQERQERVIADQEREITCQRKIITQKAITMSVIRKHLLERLNYEVTQVISSGEDDMVRMTEVMWQELEQVLNETDNNFVQELRKGYPDFKEEDIQLCMLVRLKVSNNVLAHIYHIGVAAVKKRKLNLKMKGFEITDPAIHLEDVIDRL